MKPNLPLVLSLNAGYVDTAGFLALQGLFTAHVTGNFVTLGAALAFGSSGIVSKLLALPVFCLTVIAVQYASLKARAAPARALPIMLVAMFVFLTAGAVNAIHFGRFAEVDALPQILTGMLLVIGMAVQNAAHRLHLGSAPPSTLMTGTTTQIMIDVANLLHGDTAEKPEVVRARLARLGVTVLVFALGCGLAALCFIQLGMWCFALPPVFTLVGLALHSLQKGDAPA